MAAFTMNMSLAAKVAKAPKVQLRARPAAAFAARKATVVARASFSVFAAAEADTLVKVRTIISEQLGTDLDAVAADAKFVDLGADSLDTVEIMMALEEQFEITLDEEGAEKISTVQEAADMIQDQLK
uniref:Acyl carrier protein n=1 Tax=Mantoniella antarctica TaxID=81844 RepID=A0A7S0SJN5_9CHLO|eukprot:CAMPEP_0181363416 /NCGR_PEP_ID=MMETSP1106-20121128/8717_1 /TAXON_ID=81844 /ORGANISM="Mantoniella antarctica, Strain SL-175" /LENGTH=126 /DNA_ID=CAMNT_0023477813 /DNA_START=61 /DNA_END=441 /DNA_ORIENTATION=-